MGLEVGLLINTGVYQTQGSIIVKFEAAVVDDDSGLVGDLNPVCMTVVQVGVQFPHLV